MEILLGAILGAWLFSSSHVVVVRDKKEEEKPRRKLSAAEKEKIANTPVRYKLMPSSIL